MSSENASGHQDTFLTLAQPEAANRTIQYQLIMRNQRQVRVCHVTPMADLSVQLTRNESGKQMQLALLGQSQQPALARSRQLRFPNLTSQTKSLQLRQSRMLFPEDHEQLRSDTLTQQQDQTRSWIGLTSTSVGPSAPCATRTAKARSDESYGSYMLDGGIRRRKL